MIAEIREVGRDVACIIGHPMDDPLMLGYGEHGEPDSDEYFMYGDESDK